MSSPNIDHSAVFEAAFADPKNTAIKMPPQDVNAVLANAYTTDRPFHYTFDHVWAMELLKASAPDKYLGHLVRPGSLERFPSTRDDDDIEEFTRLTDQRPWRGGEWQTVIEHVRIYKKLHRILFIGGTDFTTPDGRHIVAGKDQPIFHVEHATGGTQDAPLNLWSIVLLTEKEDLEFRERFGKVAKDPYLWVFHEVYLREDAGLRLERKPDVAPLQ